MRDIQGFVSDYIKGKKHLHLEIGIVTKGNIEYHSFGNPPKPCKAAPEHRLFEIGSLTKVFTSMLLLELQNQQRLSTDDTVSKYIQQGKNDYLKKVTLKHLATHTSGLPRLAPNLSSKKIDTIRIRGIRSKICLPFWLMLITRNRSVHLSIPTQAWAYWATFYAK